jgi:hypothetical protein
MKKITKVIKALVAQYTSGVNFPMTVKDINNGMCEYFAQGVADEVEGAKVYWGDELTTDFWDIKLRFWVENHAFGHCFIFFEDKFYDSEAPEGVDHPKQLPFYIRRLEYALEHYGESDDELMARVERENPDNCYD